MYEKHVHLFRKYSLGSWGSTSSVKCKDRFQHFEWNLLFVPRASLNSEQKNFNLFRIYVNLRFIKSMNFNSRRMKRTKTL